MAIAMHCLPAPTGAAVSTAQASFSLHQHTMATVYDFTLLDKKGNAVDLSTYKGQVLLIVNTATACGFTPQYENLEDLYKRYHDKGLTIIDVPCNQFGEQAPGSDEAISEFCALNYGTTYPQFKKAEVNGDNELPLYTFLKAQKGFAGFDEQHELTPILVDIFEKGGTNWRESSDIKWNFTKFLVDREGRVVARFEPTHDLKDVEQQILQLL